MVFGHKAPADPWPVDVLTLEYLVSGEVDEAGQKWGWVYLQALAPTSPARPLEVVVASARPTGSAGAPELTGLRACFAACSSLVALIPRGEATAAAWDGWNHGDAVAARLLVGPYLLTGTVVAPGRDLADVLLGRALAVRELTIERVDGLGDGAPVRAPRATVLTRHLHTAVQVA